MSEGVLASWRYQLSLWCALSGQERCETPSWSKWIARVESKPAYCRKCYADLKHSQNWFGVLNLLTLLLNLFKTAEILPWRHYESVISNKRVNRASSSGKAGFPQHEGSVRYWFEDTTSVMWYQRLVLTLWLAMICSVRGWQDFGSVSRLQPYGRPFKLNSLRDSLPNTQPRARRESSRRRPRGKYKYNLKRTAIRDAKNRNALCLGKIDKWVMLLWWI